MAKRAKSQADAAKKLAAVAEQPPVEPPAPAAEQHGRDARATEADERAAEQAFAAELAQQPADDATPAAPAETSAKGAAAADAAVEAVAAGVPAAEPRASVTMSDLFRELRNVPAADGYVKRSPTPRLSAETAELQARIVVALKNLGVGLGGQDKVYPWILEQMLVALQPEDSARRGYGLG